MPRCYAWSTEYRVHRQPPMPWLSETIYEQGNRWPGEAFILTFCRLALGRRGGGGGGVGGGRRFDNGFVIMFSFSFESENTARILNINKGDWTKEMEEKRRVAASNEKVLLAYRRSCRFSSTTNAGSLPTLLEWQPPCRPHQHPSKSDQKDLSGMRGRTTRFPGGRASVRVYRFSAAISISMLKIHCSLVVDWLAHWPLATVHHQSPSGRPVSHLVVVCSVRRICPGFLRRAQVRLVTSVKVTAASWDDQ